GGGGAAGGVDPPCGAVTGSRRDRGGSGVGAHRRRSPPTMITTPDRRPSSPFMGGAADGCGRHVPKWPATRTITAARRFHDSAKYRAHVTLLTVLSRNTRIRQRLAERGWRDNRTTIPQPTS